MNYNKPTIPKGKREKGGEYVRTLYKELGAPHPSA